MLVLCAIIFLSVSDSAFGQSCESWDSCEQCIQEFGCDWCITLTNPKDIVHCRLKNETSNWCQKFMTLEYEPVQIMETEEFSNATDHPIQVKPQRLKLTLRKGEKCNVTFQYKSTENFPVDLYYLMDLSNSMREYKKRLARMGNRLAETMRNITTNFKLGFGSFIDKVDLPFVSTVKEKLHTPCKESDKCVGPYSYKNGLPLTNDSQAFVDEVEAAQLSGNLDAPEGGFDALMQAMVCEEKIGWRKGATHLLIFSTDAEYHIAGDGKLGGVIEPNPARCYTSDQEYLIYDYPSISHIDYIAQKNKVNIIFAIVKNSDDLKVSYQRLSQAIENSNFGELEQDDQKVINLVVDNYKKIVQNIKFTSNATEEVDVKFTSTCDNFEDGFCKNVHVKDTLTFTATIEPRKCPTDRKQVISLHPRGLDQSLTVELEILCDCPCTNDPAAIQKNSEACSGQGDLKCGVCDCAPGRRGSSCQCDSTYDKSENASSCFMKNSVEACSDRGECSCGKCTCSSPNLSGQWCECDSNSCKKNGAICSGKGTCECNTCACQAGYSGSFCECEESKKNCIAPESGKVCSENGDCLCGQCVCKMDTNRYTGQFCEECTSCPAKRCQEFRDCVECGAYLTGKYDEKECKDVCKLNLEKVQSLEGEGDASIKKCQQPTNDNRCTMHYEYYYDDDKQVYVRALTEKVCPPPPDVLAWIIGVIGSILLAGIIMLLVWKTYTTFHDRREYAKFEKERNNPKWVRGNNPLYKEATSTFGNPMYNRSSSRISFRK